VTAGRRAAGAPPGDGPLKPALAQAISNGHYAGAIGASHLHRLESGDSRRFGFEDVFFSVAADDSPRAGEWLFGTDDIVLYDDPDRPGCYLAYNVRLRSFVHAEYIGD